MRQCSTENPNEHIPAFGSVPCQTPEKPELLKTGSSSPSQAAWNFFPWLFVRWRHHLLAASYNGGICFTGLWFPPLCSVFFAGTLIGRPGSNLSRLQLVQHGLLQLMCLGVQGHGDGSDCHHKWSSCPGQYCTQATSELQDSTVDIYKHSLEHHTLHIC